MMPDRGALLRAPVAPLVTPLLALVTRFLTLVAPFELTSPLLRLPAQSVSNLEAAVLVAFALAALAVLITRRLPDWRTPLTMPWLVVLLAMGAAAALSPVSRVNAFHMTGRAAAAFGVYLLAANGVRTPARLRSVLVLLVAVAVAVSVLAILEYLGIRRVLVFLKAFSRLTEDGQVHVHDQRRIRTRRRIMILRGQDQRGHG